MAMKVYKHAQTMVIYLVPQTEVSLFHSQNLKSQTCHLKTCNKLIVSKKTCNLAQI